MKSVVFGILALVSFSGLNASAEELNLASMFEGNYRVVNRDCLNSGNPYNSTASIYVRGNAMALEVKGPHRISYAMINGRRTTQLPNGDTVEKSGVLFGNGFSYGEIVRSGRLIRTAVEFSLTWENGKLTVKRTDRVDARHKTAAYCDLVRL